MKRTVRVISLILLLFVGLGLQVACDQNSTLAKIGRALGPVSEGLAQELLSLKQSGVITQKKYDEVIAKLVDEKGNKGRRIGEFLANIKINAGNKQEVINAIKDGVNLFSDIAGGFAAGSSVAKIVGYLTLSLNLASVAVGILDPPPAPASFSINTPPSGISAESVKIKLPSAPAEVKKYLK